jgi:hypothetical protein
MGNCDIAPCPGSVADETGLTRDAGVGQSRPMRIPRAVSALVGVIACAMLALGLSSPATGREISPDVTPQSSNLAKQCRQMLKEGSARKCVKGTVTYAARCTKKQRMYVGKCWVNYYGAYTLCTCYGPAVDGKWYWNAPG